MKFLKIGCISLALCTLFASAMPRLLIKIPTRARPQKFFQTLDKYYENLSGKTRYQFLITCDIDDASMNTPEVINKLKQYPNLTFSFGLNASKVAAINRDLHKDLTFDILLVAGDDLIPWCKDYDKIIADTMLESFPDFDGVLNFDDGFVGGVLNTYPIIGKKYFDRFGYVYYPEYESLFCNDELTTISRMLAKEKIVNQTIIKHLHPIHRQTEWDDLYRRNEGCHAHDQQLFIQRQKQHFGLNLQEIDEQMPKIWSILICTLDEREAQFNSIYSNLNEQIKKLGLEDKIEVLFYRDNRQVSVGYKRNELLNRSKGKYICFCDDDDEVHSNYIGMIYEQLLKDPDCVNLIGIITHDGRNPRYFTHSIQYNHYYEHNNVYFRPPNHLNPIRRSIAIQFLFPEKNFGEDTDWAMKIANSKLLKTEEIISEPYYFYKCVSK